MVDHPKLIFYHLNIEENVPSCDFDGVCETNVKSFVNIEGFQSLKPIEFNSEVGIPLGHCADALKFFGIDRDKTGYKCPACREDASYRSGFANLQTILIHLNDNHKWSFKQIGQWLEGLGL